MPLKTFFEINLSLSESRTGDGELGSTPPWRGTSFGLSTGGTWRQTIPAGETDVEIDLNGVDTARLIAVKTNEEIEIKKNSVGNEAWKVRPLGDGADSGVMLIMTDDVSSLFVSNNGSDDANVTFTVAGVVS